MSTHIDDERIETVLFPPRVRLENITVAPWLFERISRLAEVERAIEVQEASERGVTLAELTTNVLLSRAFEKLLISALGE